MTQTLIASALAIALAYFLWRDWQRSRVQAAAMPLQLFGRVKDSLESAEILPQESAGTWKLVARHGGRVFQFTALADTLATRKLPVLWLMVTLPEPQNITRTIDLMMRPTGPSTFSNFDFLPHTLATPLGFPEHAVIRSDSDERSWPVEALQAIMNDFENVRGKEVLVSPKGLRVVVQAGEADKLRYGVLREANFGEDFAIPPALAASCISMLLAIENDLK
jgi:hypothetical protein